MNLKNEIKWFKSLSNVDKIMVFFAYIVAIVLPITMLISLIYNTFFK